MQFIYLLLQSNTQAYRIVFLSIIIGTSVEMFFHYKLPEYS